MTLTEKLTELRDLLIQIDIIMPAIKRDLRHSENNLLNDLYEIHKDKTFGLVMKNRTGVNVDDERRWAKYCKARDITKIHRQAQEALSKIESLLQMDLNNTPIKVKKICTPNVG